MFSSGGSFSSSSLFSTVIIIVIITCINDEFRWMNVARVDFLESLCINFEKRYLPIFKGAETCNVENVNFLKALVLTLNKALKF
jgi:hypothetical protein